MNIFLTIPGGIIAGLISTIIYEYMKLIRKPRLHVKLLPQKGLTRNNISRVAAQGVRVTNSEHGRFLRKLLR